MIMFNAGRSRLVRATRIVHSRRGSGRGVSSDASPASISSASRPRSAARAISSVRQSPSGNRFAMARHSRARARKRSASFPTKKPLFGWSSPFKARRPNLEICQDFRALGRAPACQHTAIRPGLVRGPGPLHRAGRDGSFMASWAGQYSGRSEFAHGRAS